MNERIKELAEQAGWDMGDEVCGFTTRLDKFAALVAAHEREACAKVCEAIERNGAWVTKQEAAAAIRARGEQ